MDSAIQNDPQPRSRSVPASSKSDPSESTKSRTHLLSFDNLPEWLRDNEYLLNHHRPPLYSHISCIFSCFYMHTETLNIWTHLIGFLIVQLITLHLVFGRFNFFTFADYLVYLVFLMSASCCLFFSTAFHTLMCHSEGVYRKFNKADYCGISILIVGSFVPKLFYYYYFTHPHLFMCYIFIIVFLGVLATCFSMLSFFNRPKYRPLRAGLFVVFGLSGVLPTFHYISINGFAFAFTKSSVDWLVVEAAFYIFGAFIYAIRIPEKIFPGKFDIYCHSHQIFHVMVVGGILSHYYGLNKISNHLYGLN